jgi:hypothetical protein
MQVKEAPGEVTAMGVTVGVARTINHLQQLMEENYSIGG